MWLARARLACLWLSQVARVLADNCLRAFILLSFANAPSAERESAWHLLTALLALPFLLFSPFNGALSNSLPRRSVLMATSLWCAAVVLGFALTGGPWVACWALVAVGAAVYSPTRYALLPAAADDADVPLTRVNGLIEMGAVTALVAGLIVGGSLHGELLGGLPAAVGAAVGLNLFALLAAAAVWFRADVRRPESAGQAVAGFFRDARRVLADAVARPSLLGMSGLRGLMAAVAGAVLARAFGEQAVTLGQLIEVAGWLAAGIAAGSLLAGSQRHPRRALGLVPFGCTGLLVGLFVAAAAASTPGPVLCGFIGVMGGLINVPLAAAYQASVPADARGNAMSVRNFADYAFMSAAGGGMFALSHLGILDPRGQLWLCAAVALAATALAWRGLFRAAIEQVMEIVLWPLYRIHGRGPGLHGFPTRGPLLVIANHAAWLDPLWVGKVIPRRVVPMMTSAFYDLPGLKWLMKSVVQAIRVEASNYRREAPELKQALAVLDAGGCVLLFPEGQLRKRADTPLRQFGQGVALLLQDRPATPVVVCWIEGGWGSFFSYDKGPPTKNKKMDFWRRIDIAMSEPEVLDPKLLEDPLATRAYLMQKCLDARRYLGLGEVQGEKVTEDPAAAPV